MNPKKPVLYNALLQYCNNEAGRDDDVLFIDILSYGASYSHKHDCIQN